jgi:hypothetical protein
MPHGAIMGSDASAAEREGTGGRREAHEVWPVTIPQGGTGTGVVTAEAVVRVVAEALGCELDPTCVLEGIPTGNWSIPRWMMADRFRRC